MVLAGGRGDRLYPLTQHHSKPAVLFGGIYRIIDFSLSNCLNSGLRQIYLLTQHRSLSLDRHIHMGWSILNPELGEFIQTVPPQRQLVTRWYAGTADAVFHNLHLLEAQQPRYCLILSGDHVYRMDYGHLLRFHVERDADLTVACTEVPLQEAARFGVLEVDSEGQVTGLVEKPANPKPLPHDRSKALVNMGVYVFTTEPLVRAVIADAKGDTKHDFGWDIIPMMVKTHRVSAFSILRHLPEQHHYWRDIGTLDSYFRASMELVSPQPYFDLSDTTWPIRTYHGQYAPAFIRNADVMDARIVDSIVSPGCVVSGGSLTRCVLSPNVSIGPAAMVEESILMPGVKIGPRAHVRRAIIGADTIVPPDVRIGQDAVKDQRNYQITDRGIVVLPQDALVS